MDQSYQRKINTFNQTRPSNIPHDLSNSFVELTGLGPPHTVINESTKICLDLIKLHQFFLFHCIKYVRTRIFTGPYYPVYGQNRRYWRIQENTRQ